MRLLIPCLDPFLRPLRGSRNSPKSWGVVTQLVTQRLSGKASVCPAPPSPRISSTPVHALQRAPSPGEPCENNVVDEEHRRLFRAHQINYWITFTVVLLAATLREF